MSLSAAATRYLPPLEEELRAVVKLAGQHDDYMPMLTYHMGWTDPSGEPVEADGGKRIRPMLCLMACEAAGGSWERVVPVAAAIELVHNFSLIHDDIQDEGDLRRGKPTVWKIWGVPLAINAGDALFTLAHLAATRAAERGVPAETTLEAVRILDQTCLDLTLGQHLDLSFEARASVDTDSYLRMISAKTAALLSTSTRLGALIAGAGEERVEHFRQFGLCLGVAFQVIDDILGIWGAEAHIGKSKETDLQTKKKTLPVLVGLERSEALQALYAGPEPLDGDDVASAVALLDEVGARAYAEEVARRHSELALEHLDAANPQGLAEEWLRQLADDLLHRNR